MSTRPPPAPTTTANSSSSSHMYSQNYGLSRSVTVPDSQHQSRRSHSYNMSSRTMPNDGEMQQEGKEDYFSHLHWISILADEFRSSSWCWCW